MTARGPSVELREVAPGEREAFFAMLADYLAELDAYELPWDPAPPVEAYRAAIDADPDGQQIEWVVADGARSGFLITRVVPDWPEEAREVGEVIESYVEVEQRGRGVGRAAVEIWLARMRAQGIVSVEASVLWANTPARRFWERLGFETRGVQTTRRP